MTAYVDNETDFIRWKDFMKSFADLHHFTLIYTEDYVTVKSVGALFRITIVLKID